MKTVTSTESAASQESDARLEAFRPVKVRRASDEVLAVLADAIRGGLYRAGDMLPRQADLASQLGVSRHVVREAVEVLRREGVVSVKRGNSGGALVTSTRNLPRVVASIGGETQSNLRMIFEARRLIEMASGPLAASRLTTSDLERLHELSDELEPLVDDPDEFLHTDAKFHLAMVELSGNAILAEFHRSVINQVLVSTAMYPVGRIPQEAAVAYQRDTLAALESGDAQRIRDVLDPHLGALEEALLGEKISLP